MRIPDPLSLVLGFGFYVFLLLILFGGVTLPVNTFHPTILQHLSCKIYSIELCMSKVSLCVFIGRKRVC